MAEPGFFDTIFHTPAEARRLADSRELAKQTDHVRATRDAADATRRAQVAEARANAAHRTQIADEARRAADAAERQTRLLEEQTRAFESAVDRQARAIHLAAPALAVQIPLEWPLPLVPGQVITNADISEWHAHRQRADAAAMTATERANASAPATIVDLLLGGISRGEIDTLPAWPTHAAMLEQHRRLVDEERAAQDHVVSARVKAAASAGALRRYLLSAVGVAIVTGVASPFVAGGGWFFGTLAAGIALLLLRPVSRGLDFLDNAWTPAGATSAGAASAAGTPTSATATKATATRGALAEASPLVFFAFLALILAWLGSIWPVVHWGFLLIAIMYPLFVLVDARAIRQKRARLATECAESVRAADAVRGRAKWFHREADAWCAEYPGEPRSPRRVTVTADYRPYLPRGPIQVMNEPTTDAEWAARDAWDAIATLAADTGAEASLRELRAQPALSNAMRNLVTPTTLGTARPTLAEIERRIARWQAAEAAQATGMPAPTILAPDPAAAPTAPATSDADADRPNETPRRGRLSRLS